VSIDQTETVVAVSYVAHLAGAIAGLTIGLLVLKSFEQKLHEQLLWWIALGTYSALVVFAIAFNIMNGFAMFNIRVEKCTLAKSRITLDLQLIQKPTGGDFVSISIPFPSHFPSQLS